MTSRNQRKRQREENRNKKNDDKSSSKRSKTDEPLKVESIHSEMPSATKPDDERTKLMADEPANEGEDNKVESESAEDEDPEEDPEEYEMEDAEVRLLFLLP